MKHYPCEKCGTRHRPSKHHILPRVFWNGYGGLADLCVYCHRTLEKIILETEQSVSGFKGARRFKLPAETYRKILTDFLNET